GIRSSVALLITAVIADHLFLKKFNKQILLALAVFPVAVFKNGVRIITLYLLSYFVDMKIIEGGFLHKSGDSFSLGWGWSSWGFFSGSLEVRKFLLVVRVYNQLLRQAPSFRICLNSLGQ
ncbi:MAG: archaeosortase/exosortase family protein, partial [Thermoplasmata archaeon]|nr:archaeosortase/exosortase family protein [Thermoplasmata archaeon]